MRLPIATPKELSYLSEIQGDQELFNLLSQNFAESVRFFEVMAEDSDWIAAHNDFTRKYLKWIADLYFGQRLDFYTLRRLRKIFLKNYLALKPFQKPDFKLELGDEVFEVTAWLFASASFFLNDLIGSSKNRAARLSKADPEVAKLVFELVQEGASRLESESEQSLKKIIPLALQWGLNEIALNAEGYLKRCLNDLNALDTLILARKNNWKALQEASADFYSRLNYGLTIKLEEEDLFVIFNDFKELTTLETYKKIAPYTSVIGLRGDLAQLPELEWVIRSAPKLKGLDLTETSEPIAFTGIPHNLKILILKRAYWVSAEFLEQAARLLPELERLDLEDDTWLNYESFGLINQWQGLKSLNLKGLKQIESGDLGLIFLGLFHLETLNLSYVKKVSGVDIVENVRSLKRLRNLDLEGTLIDDASLAALLQVHPLLEKLNVQNCEVSTEMISKIKGRYPKLEISF